MNKKRYQSTYICSFNKQYKLIEAYFSSVMTIIVLSMLDFMRRDMEKNDLTKNSQEFFVKPLKILERNLYRHFFENMIVHGYLTVSLINLSVLVQITSKFQWLVLIDCSTFCFMEYALRQIGRILQFSEKNVQSRQYIFHDLINILLIL